MTTHIIDNSLSGLGKTVLWQYDKAIRLLSIIKHLQVWYHCAVEQFWKYWVEKVLSVDTCDSFGCSIWGMMLGIERPMITASTGERRLIVTSVYRKLLKASFYLYKADSSFGSISEYLNILFSVDGLNNLSKWQVQVSEYGWYTNIDKINGLYQSGRAYNKGEVFWYYTEENPKGSNWKCTQAIAIEKNKSFEELLENGWIHQTLEPTTEETTSFIITLKLYDPEGIERAMAIGYKNALSLSLEYEFGTTKVTAEIKRTVKCGVGVKETGNLTLEYYKTQFYDEMHRDQKALYEQLFSEVCPFPLGMGSPNEVVEEWVFGFGEFDARDYYPKYEPKSYYPSGYKFYYSDANNEGAIYITNREIFTTMNYSFSYLQEMEYINVYTTEVYEEGQGNKQYEKGQAYKQGDIFGYIDENGHGFNYKCVQDIKAFENQSFSSISQYIEKTAEGDPFVSSFSNSRPCYITITSLLPMLSYYSLVGSGYMSFRTDNKEVIDSIGNYVRPDILLEIQDKNMTVCGYNEALIDLGQVICLPKYAYEGFTQQGNFYQTYKPDTTPYRRFIETRSLYPNTQPVKVFQCNSWEDMIKVYEYFSKEMKVSSIKAYSLASKYQEDIYYPLGAYVIHNNSPYIVLPILGSYYNPTIIPMIKGGIIKRDIPTSLISEATFNRLQLSRDS